MKLMAMITLAALPIVALASCGDDDASDDPNIAKIDAVAESAAGAYIEVGAEGLYDYLASGITDKCTAVNVDVDLSDHAAPTGWKRTEDIALDGEDRATATVVMTVDDEDDPQEWSFVLEGDSWRVSDVPGLEECAQ